jgi:hypothetical protein
LGLYPGALILSDADQRTLKEYNSPNLVKIAKVEYGSPAAGSNQVPIWVKLEYKFLPFVVRSVYKDQVGLDFNQKSPYQGLDYHLQWVDNNHLYISKNQTLIELRSVGFVRPMVFDGIYKVFEIITNIFKWISR